MNSDNSEKRLTKKLGPLAFDAEDLRRVAEHMARLGDVHIRRFGVDYPDFEAFTRAHNAPYRALDFVLPNLEVQLTSKSGAILYVPESEGEALAMEKFLGAFQESPIVQYRYLHGLMLFIAAMAAVEMGQYHVLLMCFVVLGLFAHTLDDAMSRKDQMRRRKGPLNDFKMAWALLFSGIVVAKLLMKFIGS